MVVKKGRKGFLRTKKSPMDNPEYRKRAEAFFRVALQSSNLSIKRIAKLAGVRPNIVSRYNERYGFRSPEDVSRIQHMAISTTKARMKKKISFWSERDKLQLLETHRGIIVDKAKPWWGYKRIRTEYNSKFDDFLRDVESYVFENLDYFDPLVTGEKGKRLLVSGWIGIGAKNFCHYKYTDINRKKQIQIPVDKDNRSIAETGVMRQVESAPRAVKKYEIRRIPSPTKVFLKNLGWNLEDVVRTGLKEVRETIIRVSNEPGMGLNERERLVIQRRLEGKTIAEISRTLKSNHAGKKHLSVERTRQIEQRAIKKIRAALKKTLEKKKKSRQP